VVLIDSSSKVAAFNSANCVPVPKFEGERLDSTLLYLQKYLLDLHEEPDVSVKIRNDFHTAFLNRQDENSE